MSPTSTDRITLTGSQHRELTRMTRAGRTEQRLVTRAEIVLAAAAGESNAQIARWLGICEDTVRKWRRRWCAAPGVASLADAKRSGRRPKFTAVQVARVKAMACTPPRDKGLPLSRWSCPELADQAITDGICGSISPATIRRWLSEDALKPWQYQSWIFITDPDFAVKAQAGARPLRPHVGRQTVGPQRVRDLRRREDLHPGPLPLPPHPAPGKARAMRVNHEYHRRGAVAYLAAYDVHRGEGLRPLREHHRHRRVHHLVDQVMTHEPYASAERVFWIVDNGSSHRGQAAIDRLAEQFPNAIMVHTPVHASWLNQIEIYFSIVQRKVLSPNDFTDIDAVSDRLSAFENRYNQTAQPFKWKFTTTDLTELLERLDNHKPQPKHDPAQPRAA